MSRRATPRAPTFHCALGPALTRLLASKRAAGYRYRDEARALGVLDRFLSQQLSPEDPVITREISRAFVARRGDESETTREHRTSLLRVVTRFLALEVPRTAVPGPRWCGIHRRAFVPRVLSLEEAQRFLRACDALPSCARSPARGSVLGTLLAVLYLTGLRAGEGLRLADHDVDLAEAVVRVRDTKFGKSRVVPLAADLTARLRQCRTHVVTRFGPREPDAPFFPGPTHDVYSITALRAAFHHVLRLADIPRRREGQALRLHDLRHSFAVSRLTLWYRQGVDLDVVLPALAIYLGHVGLASSQRYLQVTPDLFTEITRRTQARFGHLITEAGAGR
ncbi:tyrosine-type recombinase/integrase [Luteitalea sp.]|uniref:tyrosine-type recombinase/integrase n=1 Tax=Luteitalea sp. TaxID=2004800 RepID=UPI0025B8DC25|nr:tyrosine-type recombinase/integrase [Luteitalea sp.]